MFRRFGSEITSEIELVGEENLRTRLNVSDGAAVKVTVWETVQNTKTPDEIIEEWCQAARNVEGGFGEEKAMGYLIGEKFLNFPEVAETNREWRNAIPAFVAEIKAIFETWKLAEFRTVPGAVANLCERSNKTQTSQSRTQSVADNRMSLSRIEE